MQVFSNQTSKEQRQLWAIFTPSLTSVITSLIIALGIVGGLIFITIYHTSTAPNFIAALNTQTSNTSVTHAYSSATDFLNGKSAFSDAPLVLFWAMVGVGVYAVVISISTLIKSVSETEHQTQYMHVNQREFVRFTLARLLVRLVAAACGWFVLEGLIRYLFPYSIAAAHVATQGDFVQRATYAVGAIVGIMLGLHLLVVTARVIWLRVRLLS